MINECKDELKRQSRLKLEDSFPTAEAQSDDYDALPLKDAISKLSEELRSVVILRYFHGLTIAETAYTLDIPQGTVVTRQRRALQLLKLELEEV